MISQLVLFVTLFGICIPGSLSEKGPIQLTGDTWKDMLEGEWLVKFYAPWCPACRSAEKPWADLANNWANSLDISVGNVDVTQHPGLSGRFLITSLPSIFHVKDGKLRLYKGPRSVEDLVKFVQDKEWMSTEPIPWYKDPAQMHMTALELFFKMSMVIRSFHSYMVEDLGYSVYVSYGIFAAGTIVAGIVLGLSLVMCIDRCCPPHGHPHQHQHHPEMESEDLEDDRDEAEEEEDEKEEGPAGGDREKPSPKDVRKRKNKASIN